MDIYYVIIILKGTSTPTVIGNHCSELRLEKSLGLVLTDLKLELELVLNELK